MDERHFHSPEMGGNFRVHVHQEIRQKVRQEAVHANELKDGRSPR